VAWEGMKIVLETMSALLVERTGVKREFVEHGRNCARLPRKPCSRWAGRRVTASVGTSTIRSGGFLLGWPCGLSPRQPSTPVVSAFP
jgi:hypothetical protein